MMKLIIEEGAANERPQDFRQQQIRNRLQLISRSWMSSDIHAQPTQLLNQPPDLGAVRGNFLRDFGSAHYDRRVVHQQAHDAAETNVRRRFVGGRSPRRTQCRLCRRTRSTASCGTFPDAVIMGERRENHKPSPGRLHRNNPQAHIDGLRRVSQQTD